MKAISSTATGLLLLIVACTAASAQSSSQRLPALVRSNTFLAGQVLGCLVRLDVYLGETKRNLQTSGMPLPPQLADVSALMDMDAEALKADVLSVMQSQPQDLISIDGIVEATQQIALAEFGNADGLHAPAWVQTAGCGTVMRQLGLYEAYPFAGSTVTSINPPAASQEGDVGSAALAAIGRQIGACVNIPERTPADGLRGWKLYVTVDHAGGVVSAYADTSDLPLANAVQRAAERCGPYVQVSNSGFIVEADSIFADR